MVPFTPEPQVLLEGLDIEFGGPHVVAVGGGTGLAKVLKAATAFAGRVDGVVSVADDGGSSGRLAPALDIPPPGDIRKCLIALAGDDDSVWRKLFEYRFLGADVKGHSLGNLLLAGLADIEGSFEGALRRAEELLGTAGSVIPACQHRLHLKAEADGQILEGQVTIQNHQGRIDVVTVVPDSVAPTPHAIEAIESADVLILGPGSLITSTIAAMRVPGITEAINRADAKLVYVANLITQDAETLGMDGIDHLDALLRLTGVRPPGTIVCNENVIDVSPPLQGISFDPELTATYGADLVSADLVDEAEGWPSHDPRKLGAVLAAIARR